MNRREPRLSVLAAFFSISSSGELTFIPKAEPMSIFTERCSRSSVLGKVPLPLTAPGLVVTALFCFIWSWNDFMFALILTRNQAMTIPVASAGTGDPHGLMWNEVSATAAMGTLPIIVLAILLQKYLVRGLSLGSLK